MNKSLSFSKARKRASKAYATAAVTTADPKQLWEKSIKTLSLLLDNAADMPADTRNTQLSLAIRLITELKSGIDHEQGETSAKLAAYYDALIFDIIRATRDNDTAALVMLAEDVRDMWRVMGNGRESTLS